jgi:DNA-binding MarR family transcriptional regulator
VANTPKRPIAPDQPSSVSEEFAESLGAVVRWSRRRFFELVSTAANVQIDSSSMSILNTLARHGLLRTSELAAILGLDRSTVSRQIAPVLKAGYVTRSEDVRDARAALLSLTPEGKRVYKRITAAWRVVAEGLVNDWDPSDRADIARLLDKLTARMDVDRT